MKQALVIVASLIAGFAGGVLGMLVVRSRDQAHPAQVIRAHSFELVNETGRPVSLWGFDKNHYAVLAFGRSYPADSPEARALVGKPPVDLTAPENQSLEIGVGGDEPVLNMRAADGRERVGLFVNEYGKPSLWMGDQTGSRVVLGCPHGDTGEDLESWFLDFDEGRAALGVYGEKSGSRTFVQGFLDVKKEKVAYPK